MEAVVALSERSRWVYALQVVLVVALIPVGLTLGGLTGVLVLSPVFGMALPLTLATWMLRRDGMRWRDLGFPVAMPVGRFLLATGAAVGGVVVFMLLAPPFFEAVGLPVQDVSSMKALIEGNLFVYLVFLIPISWGSAAFGEEILIRGFLLDRLQRLRNTR